MEEIYLYTNIDIKEEVNFIIFYIKVSSHVWGF